MKIQVNLVSTVLFKPVLQLWLMLSHCSNCVEKYK